MVLNDDISTILDVRRPDTHHLPPLPEDVPSRTITSRAFVLNHASFCCVVLRFSCAPRTPLFRQNPVDFLHQRIGTKQTCTQLRLPARGTPRKRGPVDSTVGAYIRRYQTLRLCPNPSLSKILGLVCLRVCQFFSFRIRVQQSSGPWIWVVAPTT